MCRTQEFYKIALLDSAFRHVILPLALILSTACRIDIHHHHHHNLLSTACRMVALIFSTLMRAVFPPTFTSKTCPNSVNSRFLRSAASRISLFHAEDVGALGAHVLHRSKLHNLHEYMTPVVPWQMLQMFPRACPSLIVCASGHSGRQRCGGDPLAPLRPLDFGGRLGCRLGCG